jgi:hypothetical protein
MAFKPSIQTYAGPHAVTSPNAPYNCAVDFDNDAIWMADATNMSKYGITSGSEVASALVSTVPSGMGNMLGRDGVGYIYMPTNPSLYHGGLAKINASTLEFVSNTNYVAPAFVYTNAVNSGGSPPTMLGTNVGNGVIGSLNSTSFTNNSGFISTIGWPAGHDSCRTASGADGSNISWHITSNKSGGSTAVLKSYDSTVTLGISHTYSPTDFDGAWTGIIAWGICVDQTDGHPIVVVGGAPGQSVRLAKLNKSTGAIIWNVSCHGFAYKCGQQLCQSRITNQRLALLGDSPTGVTIFNTSDGSVVSSYSEGFTGIIFNGQQCYNDKTGALVCMVNSWTGSSNGPTPLNGSSAPFSGWATLYVAPTPSASSDDGWFHVSKPLLAP